ncbi:type I-E CRISPR-associated protein Cse2/CasB [Knoellia koreensis]|uniref:Type I-E CRISPR-associated protein Cse2/CasB n=1 Tax=Knoellia koreensis TaxID=2730921 RepID=A0A849H995_9MICO|nr:type I-E CRISPR-associated protein Cse2/CasB [Knoellia sp. DB2414S]NNM46440.1 type I-E CRISPR-associated protein Cse2/CasB [Knoellia sp. DB2414S]
MTVDSDNAVSSTDGGVAPPYWERRPEKGGGVPPGQDLAALRRGVGAEPGSIPLMWPMYTTFRPDGSVSPELRAEHHALALFGVHQQSQTSPMHRPGVRLGEALRALRESGRYSESALDRRVAQCATADSLDEFAHHLRSLVTMLKTLPQPQGLDYTALTRDFLSWQRPHGRLRVRRRLGADYFRKPGSAKPSTPDSSERNGPL